MIFKNYIMKIKFLIALLLITISSFAQDKKIRVAVNESRPYVVFHRDHGKILRCTGLSVDVLHYLFGENIEYVYCASKQAVIDAVMDGQADVGANVTLTSDRMDNVDYSLPYLRTYVGILAKKPSQPTFAVSFWIAVQNPKFLYSLVQGVLIIQILAWFIGLLIYLLEYRKRDKSYFDACHISLIGILFFAGLEDEPTKRISKNMLVYTAMIFYLSFSVYMIAYFTTLLQERNAELVNYENIHALKKTTVYTAPYTSTDVVLADAGIEHKFGSIDSVYNELCEGHLVYSHDKNILQNYIFENDLSDKLALTPIVIQRTSRVLIYSKPFAKHRKEYDKILLKMEKNGKTEEMALRYGITP